MHQFFWNRNNGKYETIQTSIVLVPSPSSFNLGGKFFITRFFSLLDLFIIIKTTKGWNVYIVVFSEKVIFQKDCLFSLVLHHFLKTVFNLVLYSICITWRTTPRIPSPSPSPPPQDFFNHSRAIGGFRWNFSLVHRFLLTHFEIIFSVIQNVH